MKHLMFFLFILAAGIGIAVADNDEIVIYNVSASSDFGVTYSNHNYVADLWASASVSAESGSEGWFSVWAEAGSDRGSGNRESGSYVAGRNGFSKSKYASSQVSRADPDWGYIFRASYINSQDDEDWSPK